MKMINNDIIYMNIKSTRSLYDDVLPIVDRRVGSRFTKVVGKIFLWSVCWGKKERSGGSLVRTFMTRSFSESQIILLTGGGRN